MGTLTIRVPDDTHERLKRLAQARGVSINKLIEEMSTAALAEFDAETRFRIRAARGDAAAGLRVLDRLDKAFGAQGQGVAAGQPKAPYKVGRRRKP
jgi:predicted transcriptional regulator